MTRRHVVLGLAMLLISAASMSVAGAAQSARPQATGGALAERYSRAQKAFEEQRGNEDKTRSQRDFLAQEARNLQERLIANASRVQALEAASESTAGQLDRLNGTMRTLQADLSRDREVVHLDLLRCHDLGARDG